MNQWQASLLLCDAAQVADGKLYVLGGGWSVCGPGPFVHALAAKIEVPWDQANRRHRLRAELLDEDQNPIRLGDSVQDVFVETDFEVGRPAGIPPGTPLDFPFAINLGPIELPAAGAYSWRLSVDGEEIHRSHFLTRPRPKP